MRPLVIYVAVIFLMVGCSKSAGTSYTTPPPPATEKRLIKFAYEGDVYGVPPIYKGLADTPQHKFEATGITESDFVKTKAGDTIHITIPLCSEGTKPIVTLVEDDEDRKPVAPDVSELPTTDATAQFRVVVK